MTCKLCTKPATVECEWGHYQRTEPMNQAQLCDSCSNMVWKQVKSQVNAGICHWVNRKIESEVAA